MFPPMEFQWNMENHQEIPETLQHIHKPFLCFQQRVIPVLYSSPGLEQKQWYEHTHHPKKNKLNNTINAAPTKHRQRRRGCASYSAVVERMHQSGSWKWAMRCFNKNRRARLQDHEWWLRGDGYQYILEVFLYTHTRVYCIMFPFFNITKNRVMIFFLQENFPSTSEVYPVNPWPRPWGLGFGMPKTRCLTSLPNTWRTGPWQRHGCWGNDLGDIQITKCWCLWMPAFSEKSEVPCFFRSFFCFLTCLPFFFHIFCCKHALRALLAWPL